MKTIRVATAILTSLTIVWLSSWSLAVSAQSSQEQNQATALLRGYRTGYSDGYQEGVSDAAKNANPRAVSRPPHGAFGTQYSTASRRNRMTATMMKASCMVRSPSL